MSSSAQQITPIIAPNTTGTYLPAIQTGTNGNQTNLLPFTLGTGLTLQQTGTGSSATLAANLNNGGNMQIGAAPYSLPPAILLNDITVTTAYISTSPAYASTTPVLSQTICPTNTGNPIRVRLSGTFSASTPTNTQSSVFLAIYYSINGGTPVQIGYCNQSVAGGTYTGYNVYGDLYFDELLTAVTTSATPVTFFVGATIGPTTLNTGTPKLYSANASNVFNGLDPLTLFLEEVPVQTSGVVGYSSNVNTTSASFTIGSVTVGSLPALSATQLTNSVVYQKVYPNTILKVFSSLQMNGNYNTAVSAGLYLATTGTAASAQFPSFYPLVSMTAGTSTLVNNGTPFSLSGLYLATSLAVGSYTASLGLQGNNNAANSIQQSRLSIYETNPYGAAGVINSTFITLGSFISASGSINLAAPLGQTAYASTSAITNFAIKTNSNGGYVEIDMVFGFKFAAQNSSQGQTVILYFYLASNLNAPIFQKVVSMPYYSTCAHVLFWVPSTGAGEYQTIYIGAAVLNTYNGQALSLYYNGIWEEKCAPAGYAGVNSLSQIVVNSATSGTIIPNVVNQLTASTPTSYVLPSIGRFYPGMTTTILNTAPCTITVGQGQQAYIVGAIGATAPTFGTLSTGTIVINTPGSQVSLFHTAPTGTQKIGYIKVVADGGTNVTVT